MITAYVFAKSEDGQHNIGIVYEKDGKLITERQLIRADKEEIGVHGGNTFGATAAIYDCEKIGKQLGDSEMTVVVDDENIVGLENGEEPDCPMVEKLLNFIFVVSAGMGISISPPYQGMEEFYGRAKELACQRQQPAKKLKAA